ncbi:caspase family protein, partial [Leptolyngbya cf. ectocarpi LEGE 11479]
MAKYALVIGLTDYDDFNQLTRPATDAQVVAEVLQTYGGYRITSILAATDYDEIVAQLKTFLQQTAHKNEALIYITGHSFLVQDDFTEEQAGYIATSNCRVRRENDAIVEQRHGIPFVNFNKLIAKADLSNLVLLLDTCHSGGLIEQGLFQQSFNTFGQKTDYFFITAARSSESAWAKRGENHSVFTTALLSGLAQENAPEGGAITGDDLFAHIARQLQQARQEPMRMGQGRSIEIVRYGTSVETQISDENPYQGLKAFDENSARFFFGREKEIDLLLAKLSQTNFVPVIGVSGSGKSSVVRAGLIPALRQMGHWQILEPMKPGIGPMALLKNAFCQLVSQRREVNHMAAKIDSHDLLGAVALLPGTEKILLVVDQFEEVFALGSPDEEKQQFIDCLTAIANVEESRLAIVTTMRADFLPDWLGYGELIESIQKDAVFLGRLQGQALLDAVEKPAQVQGHSMENGLLQLIADDMAAASNALPLLEFALEALWDQRDTQHHCLTVDAYTAMDRLKGTLDSQATKVYDRLAKNEKDWCRRICLSLIRIGKDGKDTRQRQRQSKLLALGQTERERETIADVVERLVNARLLVTDGDGASRYVDIAHEALMDGWQQFADWRQEDRDLKRLGQRTRDAHEEWVGHESHLDYLIPSGLLAELRELPVTVRNNVLADMDLRAFFTRSNEHEQKQKEFFERALAEVHLDAEASKIRSKLINMPQYAVEATLDAIDAVGYSLKSFKGEVQYPIKDALNHTWRQVREVAKMQGHKDAIWSVAFSPDGSRIVSGSADSTLRLWDSEGNPIGQPWLGHSDWIWSVAFSPDGSRIVSGSRDTNLRLWTIDGQPIGSSIEGHLGSVLSVAFSPQGDRIISASDDGTLRFWDASGRSLGSPINAHKGSVYSVAFSPDGSYIVSGGSDNTLRLWDLEGNSIGEPFEGHSDWVRSVAFSPSGEQIISGSADKTLCLWALNGERLRRFYGHKDLVYSVAFSPDGNQVISSSRDHTVYVWNLDSELIDQPLYGHSGLVYSIAFSPTDKLIVSGSADRTLRIWSSQSNPIIKAVKAHSDSINALAFSPDGNTIVSGSSDHTLRLWDRIGNPLGEYLEGHSDGVLTVAFSPTGDQIVSSGFDKTLRFWDQDGNSVEVVVDSHRSNVNALAFSPDGTQIVSGSSDHTLRIWNRNGHLIGECLQSYVGEVYAVRFSPDGTKIAVGGFDGGLSFWHPRSNLIDLKPATNQSFGIMSLAFSPTEKYLISGDAYNNLRFWDYDGNPIKEPIQKHLSPLAFVEFIPESDQIVSGSYDTTLHFWDREGRPIGTHIGGEPLENDQYGITALAVSPKGNQIVCAGRFHSSSSYKDGILWFLDSIRWQDWLHDCCTRLLHQIAMVQPKTDVAQRACQVCMDHAWNRGERAKFLVAQGRALAYYQQDVDGAVA